MEPHNPSRPSLTNGAMNAIVQLIVDNAMQPGDKLPTEQQLTEMLGIGRSTLREATRSLANRNVLEIRQGVGTFVSGKRGISDDPLGVTFMKNDPRLSLELFETRMLLEPQCAAWAAANATPEQLEQLERYCLDIERRIDAGENYYEVDLAFHSLIAECGGNRVMANLVPIVVSSISLATVSQKGELRDRTALQHRRILNAITRKDPFGASMAMTEHLNMNREFCVQMLTREKIQE